MIQRIQTLFLLIASGALFGQFGIPYLSADAGNPAQSLPQLADGVLNPMDNFGLLGLTLMGGVVSLVAVFLFRNRALQARLAGSGLLVSILLLALAAFFTKTTLDAVPEGGVTHFGLGWVLPVLAILNQWLAMRNIRNDEKKVRDLNSGRLR